MSVKIKSSGGGSAELAPSNTSANTVATIPARTGNLAMDGPCFSAYQSVAHSLVGNADTLVLFQTEEFDTNACFDNGALSRFTPNIAGTFGPITINAGVVVTIPSGATWSIV